MDFQRAGEAGAFEKTAHLGGVKDAGGALGREQGRFLRDQGRDDLARPLAARVMLEDERAKLHQPPFLFAHFLREALEVW